MIELYLDKELRYLPIENIDITFITCGEEISGIYNICLDGNYLRCNRGIDTESERGIYLCNEFSLEQLNQLSFVLANKPQDNKLICDFENLSARYVLGEETVISFDLSKGKTYQHFIDMINEFTGETCKVGLNNASAEINFFLNKLYHPEGFNFRTCTQFSGILSDYMPINMIKSIRFTKGKKKGERAIIFNFEKTTFHGSCNIHFDFDTLCIEYWCYLGVFIDYYLGDQHVYGNDIGGGAECTRIDIESMYKTLREYLPLQKDKYIHLDVNGSWFYSNSKRDWYSESTDDLNITKYC